MIGARVIRAEVLLRRMFRLRTIAEGAIQGNLRLKGAIICAGWRFPLSFCGIGVAWKERSFKLATSLRRPGRAGAFQASRLGKNAQHGSGAERRKTPLIVSSKNCAVVGINRARGSRRSL
jgi:hypothetical protein